MGSVYNDQFSLSEITLLKYCTYDKRARLNFNQIYEIAALS